MRQICIVRIADYILGGKHISSSPARNLVASLPCLINRNLTPPTSPSLCRDSPNWTQFPPTTLATGSSRPVSSAWRTYTGSREKRSSTPMYTYHQNTAIHFFHALRFWNSCRASWHAATRHKERSVKNGIACSLEGGRQEQTWHAGRLPSQDLSHASVGPLPSACD